MESSKKYNVIINVDAIYDDGWVTIDWPDSLRSYKLDLSKVEAEIGYDPQKAKNSIQ